MGGASDFGACLFGWLYGFQPWHKEELLPVLVPASCLQLRRFPGMGRKNVDFSAWLKLLPCVKYGHLST